LGDFGLTDEVFGVISIPVIDLSMPIYLGATDVHLANGAAQLSQTSLPIGGNNTNCVIAGHRGWNGAAYFRSVTVLQPGDTVIITNLWETLTYTVTATDIIEPYDVEKILIQDGKDMLTLLTCHPYASGGKQRYVIYCERKN
jgi:sortase A